MIESVAQVFYILTDILPICSIYNWKIDVKKVSMHDCKFSYYPLSLSVFDLHFLKLLGMHTVTNIKSSCWVDPLTIMLPWYHYASFLSLHFPYHYWASLVAQMVTHLPAMWETRVWSLGLEDPLEKEMATHSSTLAWRIPCPEEPGGLQSMGSQRVRHNWVTNTFTFSLKSMSWSWMSGKTEPKEISKSEHALRTTSTDFHKRILYLSETCE